MFYLKPIGVVKQNENYTILEIFDEYIDGLDGLKEGDYIIILLWFHKNDDEEKRKILKVHPKKNLKNPLKGVFATRSPYRPNPIGKYTVKIHKINKNKIIIDKIDAYDKTPIIDIKIFSKELDCPK
ncbi:tRNA (N6-threonylcarbamoyladenosine(37)-N6)-methyltransferase TrmO [Methanocaldococcus sp.]|uniref:tRNA (N6-threonylcarbamoyladenosine(37)-N6)-methyltransferase TrmO n=1 Tax=Methanocaldococcus sp. TaxID=2152917 RepID=UPI002632EADC|nr:tRNA (N6-threonylcarbamoyladenosine(37)-N6)-methyltransferase TrmO [Methanocaldococcus sp.]MCQ6254454.1 tRNA (N6-threonylcarbamoyladenosine(37)-N6)-methyltransferase TrmO [Methanocaldococcus sp.]